MVSYGLIGTFVVDAAMTIKTVRVSREIYNIMLRRSLIYCLYWFQRNILLSDRGALLKERLSKGLLFDDKFNKRLINYYETFNGNLNMEKNIFDEIKSSFGIDDILNEKILAASCDNGKYLIFVPVNNKNHKDYIPLLSVNL